MTSPCKSCRAPILWALTPAGKRMPLDAEPDRDGNIQLGHIGGEEIAIVLKSADIAAAQVAQLPLYRSHFATCPQAAEHRRRGSEPADSRVPLKEAGARSDAP